MRHKFLQVGDPGYHPIRKFGIVLSGLRHALVQDFSVLYKLLLSLPILAGSLIFHEWVDAAVVVLATGVVLAAELFNTAVEALCDLFTDGTDHRVRIVKDIAAAAAGIAVLAWAIVIASNLLRLWPLITG